MRACKAGLPTCMGRLLLHATASMGMSKPQLTCLQGGQRQPRSGGRQPGAQQQLAQQRHGHAGSQGAGCGGGAGGGRPSGAGSGDVQFAKQSR